MRELRLSPDDVALPRSPLDGSTADDTLAGCTDDLGALLLAGLLTAFFDWLRVTVTCLVTTLTGDGATRLTAVLILLYREPVGTAGFGLIGVTEALLLEDAVAKPGYADVVVLADAN
jgi:hypothetical protein